MNGNDSDDRRASEDWWHTSIIEMEPGMIRYRGYAIEDLIGRISFPAMIWLMLRENFPRTGRPSFSAPPSWRPSTTARRLPP